MKSVNDANLQQGLSCRSISRRQFLTAITATTAGAVLAAPNSAAPQAQPQAQLGYDPTKEVTIHGLVVDSFTRMWQEILVPEFNKAFPKIKVVIDPVPYPDMLTKSMLELTKKPLAYDFLIIDDPWIPTLADSGLLTSLKDEFKSVTKPDYDWEDFHPAPLAAGYWKGAQYGVPVSCNELLMFYNKALFKKAGVPVPVPTWTWADFEKAAQALVKAGQVAFDTNFKRHVLTPTVWQAIMNSMGGRLLDDNMKPVFNDKTGVDALESHIRFANYGPPGCKTHYYQEINEGFRQGQVAMIWQWGSVYFSVAIDPKSTTLKSGDAGIWTLPRGTAGPAAHRGIWSFGIPKNTPNKMAAWQYVQWATSKQGEKFNAAKVGALPARKSTLTAQQSDQWIAEEFKAVLAGFEAISLTKAWRPRMPDEDALQEILAVHHSRAVSGQVSAKQALDDAAKEVADMMEEKGYYKKS